MLCALTFHVWGRSILLIVTIVGTHAREVNRASSSSRLHQQAAPTLLPRERSRSRHGSSQSGSAYTSARTDHRPMDWFRRSVSVKVGTRLPLDRPRRNGECGMDQPPPAQGSHRTLWRKRGWVRPLRVPRVRARWPHGDKNLFEVQPPRNSKIPPTIACQHGFRRREGLPEELTGRSIFRRARISNKLVLRQLKHVKIGICSRCKPPILHGRPL